MKRIISALLLIVMAVSFCSCGSSPQVQMEYFEENPALPTPAGITSLSLCGSSTSTSNGVVKKIEYRFDTKKDVNEECEKYLNVLQEQGFSINRSSNVIDVKKDDILMASISFFGSQVVINLNPQSVATKADTAEFTNVNFGDKLDLGFAELTIGKISTGKISVGEGIVFSQSAQSEGNDLYWLPITVKNLNGQEFKITGSHQACRMIFDDKYTYNGRMQNIEGGNAKAIAPLETRTIFLFAEVPNELLNSYRTVKIQFGFDRDFSENGPMKELGEYEYLYQLTATK